MAVLSTLTRKHFSRFSLISGADKVRFVLLLIFSALNWIILSLHTTAVIMVFIENYKKTSKPGFKCTSRLLRCVCLSMNVLYLLPFSCACYLSAWRMFIRSKWLELSFTLFSVVSYSSLCRTTASGATFFNPHSKQLDWAGRCFSKKTLKYRICLTDFSALIHL